MELPRGDFAFTVQRNLMVATLLKLLWQRLATSSDAELAAIAGKAVKEARYHQQHAADWVVRLGDGTDESQRRSQAALAQLWRYVPELFEADAVDDAAAASGLGPRWADVQADWQAEVGAVLAEAGLTPPAAISLPQHRQARCAHRAHGLHPGRDCSNCSAPIPGACGDALPPPRGACGACPPGGHRQRPGSAGSAAAAWFERRAHRAGLGCAVHRARPRGAGAEPARPGHRARRARAGEGGATLDVVLTPTYSGCPATEVISQSVVDAITAAGLGPVTITMQRAPAWTTDWISDDGRRKLRDVRHCAARPGGRRRRCAHPPGGPARGAGHRLPALRQQPDRAAVGLRLHRLQVAVPLHRLPRAV